MVKRKDSRFAHFIIIKLNPEFQVAFTAFSIIVLLHYCKNKTLHYKIYTKPWANCCITTLLLLLYASRHVCIAFFFFAQVLYVCDVNTFFNEISNREKAAVAHWRSSNQRMISITKLKKISGGYEKKHPQVLIQVMLLCRHTPFNQITSQLSTPYIYMQRW